MNRQTLTRNVWILSCVSLFTDMASEVLYPIMPVYLKSIGFSILLIGVLEGFAEAVAGLSKGYFGNLSDRNGKRLPFVQIGYAMSAIAKPMMAAFIYPAWIFLARAIDRLGKGIRTGARDALLSEEATPQTKGRVFGFHRAMDTLGAVLGPLSALAYLAYRPGDYQTLFVLAFLPGMLAILLTLLVDENHKIHKHEKVHPGFLDFLRYWKQSPKAYRQLSATLLAFSLFNSSDVFLLLKIKQAGFTDSTVIAVYVFYNLVYAAFSLPLGVLADKLGMKRILFAGLLLFACAYMGMVFAESDIAFFFLFFLYGVYAAATEGIAKAWITNICSKDDTATAIGTFTAFQSLTALLSSSLAGLVWFSFGASMVFAVSGIAAVFVAISILRIGRY